MIQQIEFIKQVPSGAGGTIGFWSTSSNGKTIRAERCAEGVRLVFGKRIGEEWQATGTVVLVPFANIASITFAGEDAPPPDPVSPRARSRA